jgi:hypothetical protein
MVARRVAAHAGRRRPLGGCRGRQRRDAALRCGCSVDHRLRRLPGRHELGRLRGRHLAAPAGRGQPVKLASEEVDAVAWSHGGRALAIEGVSIAGCSTGSTKCAEWYLLVFDPAGEPIGRIDNARNFAWSPDGTRLVFESGLLAVAPEEGTIDIANRDGSGRKTVSGGVAKESDLCWSYPVWVGNHRVEFDEAGCDPDYGTTTVRTVVVKVPSGRLVRSITGSRLSSSSPDRKHVAYLLRHGGDVVLYVAAADGRQRRRL